MPSNGIIWSCTELTRSNDTLRAIHLYKFGLFVADEAVMATTDGVSPLSCPFVPNWDCWRRLSHWLQWLECVINAGKSLRWRNALAIQETFLKWRIVYWVYENCTRQWRWNWPFACLKWTAVFCWLVVKYLWHPNSSDLTRQVLPSFSGPPADVIWFEPCPQFSQFLLRLFYSRHF